MYTTTVPYIAIQKLVYFLLLHSIKSKKDFFNIYPYNTMIHVFVCSSNVNIYNLFIYNK